MSHEPEHQPPRKTRHRLILILGLLVILYLTRGLWLQFLGDILVVNTDHPESADAVVVLMGDQDGERARKTLEILNQGLAKQVIVPGDKPVPFDLLGITRADSDLHRTFFLKGGVQPSALVVLDDCENTSTVEEALCLKDYIVKTEPQVKSIILVTSWYHSARAQWVFKKLLGSGVSIQTVAAPLNGETGDGWWTNERSFLYVFEEYLKFIYWNLRFLREDF